MSHPAGSAARRLGERLTPGRASDQPRAQRPLPEGLQVAVELRHELLTSLLLTPDAPIARGFDEH